ncbi:MAG: ribose-phosphate pyrophosphokinase [Planctomycetota bacterium]|nr:MAG: ribose-phosphate pyrophosphokinase [Planctomycetota bacterium]
MQSKEDRFKVLSGSAHPALASEICAELGLPLAKTYVGRFPDGEIDIKIEEDMRGGDVFVVQPTCPPVNEHLMELLLLIDCLRRASADRITAVIPYYGYARKDRKDEGRVPISAKLVANCIVAAGADRVLTMDLHASQIQGFFDVPVDHLYAKPVIQAEVEKLGLDKLVVCSPDVGGIRLARAYARSLNAGLAIVDKRRVGATETVSENVIGEVAGKNVLLVDDMISTAGSITEATRMLQSRGAERVYIAVTHAVLCGPAVERLENCPCESILVTNTIPLRGEVPNRLRVVSIAPLLARAIARIHRAESVSALFEET